MKFYLDSPWLERKDTYKLLQRITGKDLWVICYISTDGYGPAGDTALRVISADWSTVEANWCELSGNFDPQSMQTEQYTFEFPTIFIPEDFEIFTTEELLNEIDPPYDA